MKRNPWHLLTTRGKAFLLVGVAVVVAGMLLGQRDLLWLGALLFFLPVIAVAFIARTRLRLACERGTDHGQIPIGESLECRLTLTKAGSLPAGVLMFEDHAPPQLGRRPRFTVANSVGQWRREISYPLAGRQRGRFRTGPLLVRSTDALGLVKFDRQFTATTQVMVTPRISPLPSMGNVTGGGTTGENRPQHIGVIGQDDVLVREYRHGDDVRRVHWRSTAKRGELMVRREEQAWDPSVTMVLDSRAGSHAGRGRDSSFEYAVSCAASVALHFLDDGFDVDLYDCDGPMISMEDTERFQTTDQHVLRCYTDVGLSEATSLQPGLEHASLHHNGQLIMAVLGRLTTTDVELLLRSRRNRAQGLAIVLDVESFPGGRATVQAAQEQERAVQMLRSHRWRVAVARADTPIRDAWLDLERMGEFV